MKKLGILVMALVLVVGMSVGVMAGHFGIVDDDFKNDLDQEQTITETVTVSPFATFVTERTLETENIDPDNTQTFTADFGIEDPSLQDIDNFYALAQYKWTLRANTSTWTTVTTNTPEVLENNANVFYEFSAGLDSKNDNPDWLRYLDANETVSFGEQVYGLEYGHVMIGMDSDKYKENWEKIEAKDYNMSVTFTISGTQ